MRTHSRSHSALSLSISFSFRCSEVDFASIILLTWPPQQKDPVTYGHSHALESYLSGQTLTRRVINDPTGVHLGAQSQVILLQKSNYFSIHRLSFPIKSSPAFWLPHTRSQPQLVWPGLNISNELPWAEDKTRKATIVLYSLHFLNFIAKSSGMRAKRGQACLT